jgi:hypothetical protein
VRIKERDWQDTGEGEKCIFYTCMAVCEDGMYEVHRSIIKIGELQACKARYEE